MLKKQLYNARQIADAVKRIARNIIQDFPEEDPEYTLLGLYKQGVPLSERIADEIQNLTGKRPHTGKLDISMYRDDFGQRSALPLIRETEIPFDIDGINLVLVDDVLSSGRTIRAALDAVTDYGRPRRIKLAVLADRNNPEYPIRADYIGFLTVLPADRKVSVEFEPDGIYEIEWNK